MVKCSMIGDAINNVRNEDDRGCEGCKIKHESQRQHMGMWGCMVEWTDAVDEAWDYAYLLVDNEQVVKKKEIVLNENIITSLRQKLTLPSEDEMKELVKKLDEMGDNEFISKYNEL
ncbi:hypothetical protein ACF0H5_005238 [Mactra antiquata]